MASLHPLPHPTIQLPNCTPSSAKVRPPSLLSFRRHGRVPASSAEAPSGSPPSAAPEKPEIELEFVGSLLWFLVHYVVGNSKPKPGKDGAYPVDRAKALSGEKLLRNIMLDNKIELYAAYGKVMNCGGGGSCGTCIVEIIDGNELLNERTNTEQRYLKKMPESWRLACQTIVGNKENSGKVVVQRLPQWKK